MVAITLLQLQSRFIVIHLPSERMSDDVVSRTDLVAARYTRYTGPHSATWKDLD